MDVVHTTGAAMKPIYNKSNKLPMYSGATGLPIWDSVAITNDFIYVRVKINFPSFKKGVEVSGFERLGFGSDVGFFTTYLAGGTVYGHGTPFNSNTYYEHLRGYWGWYLNTDAFQKPVFAKLTDWNLSTNYFSENDQIPVRLNQLVGFDYGDITIGGALLWYQNADILDAETSNPNKQIYVTAWRSSNPDYSVSSDPPIDAVTGVFDCPWIDCYDYYDRSLPQSEADICKIHWDNETDTISII